MNKKIKIVLLIGVVLLAFISCENNAKNDENINCILEDNEINNNVNNNEIINNNLDSSNEEDNNEDLAEIIYNNILGVDSFDLVKRAFAGSGIEDEKVINNFLEQVKSYNDLAEIDVSYNQPTARPFIMENDDLIEGYE